MKKTILLYAVVLMAAMMLVGGGTYAYFSATAANNDNVFASGTIDIDSYRDGFDTIPGPMFYTTKEEGETPTGWPGLKPTGYWEPGKTHIRTLVVYNQGSLDAVLDKVSASIVEDESEMASVLNVGIYKILPKYNSDGTPFIPVQGDDCVDKDVLEELGYEIMNFLLTLGNLVNVTGLTQELIEQDVANADLLWEGTLQDLIDGEQTLNPPVNMRAVKNPFIKRGCLLAFVVQMDPEAGNDYQAANAKFNFTVTAHLQDN